MVPTNLGIDVSISNDLFFKFSDKEHDWMVRNWKTEEELKAYLMLLLFK